MKQCNHDLQADEACTLLLAECSSSTDSNDGIYACMACDGVFVGLPPRKRDRLQWKPGELEILRATVSRLEAALAVRGTLPTRH